MNKELVERDWINLFDSIEPLKKPLRECRSQVYREIYYEANKDKIKTNRKIYYEANKDKIKAYRKAYYEAKKVIKK